MVAVSKIFSRCKAPAAVRLNGGAAQYVITILDGHYAARFAVAGQFRTRVVSDVAVGHVAGDRALVVIDGANGDLVRIRINGEADARRRIAAVTGRIRDHSGDFMIAFIQRRFRGVFPLTVVADHGGANHFAVVDDVHHAARFSITAEGRGLIVGGVAVGDRAGLVTHIVVHHHAA